MIQKSHLVHVRFYLFFKLPQNRGLSWKEYKWTTLACVSFCVKKHLCLFSLPATGKQFPVAARWRRAGLWASTKPKWSSYPREEVPADCPLFFPPLVWALMPLCPLDPLSLKPLKAPSCSAPSLLRRGHTQGIRGLYMVNHALGTHRVVSEHKAGPRTAFRRTTTQITGSVFVHSV